MANHQKTKKGKAKIENLDLIYRYLCQLKKAYPIEFEIVTDATLRYQINNVENLEHAYEIGKYRLCPNKIEADVFILEFYQSHPDRTFIISNDNFTKYGIPDLPLYKFLIIFNEPIIIPNIQGMFKYNLQSTFKEGEIVAETN